MEAPPPMSPHPGLFGMCGVFALPKTRWSEYILGKRSQKLRKFREWKLRSDFLETMGVEIREGEL